MRSAIGSTKSNRGTRCPWSSCRIRTCKPLHTPCAGSATTKRSCRRTPRSATSSRTNPSWTIPTSAAATKSPRARRRWCPASFPLRPRPSSPIPMPEGKPVRRRRLQSRSLGKEYWRSPFGDGCSVLGRQRRIPAPNHSRRRRSVIDQRSAMHGPIETAAAVAAVTGTAIIIATAIEEQARDARGRATAQGTRTRARQPA